MAKLLQYNIDDEQARQPASIDAFASIIPAAGHETPAEDRATFPLVRERLAPDAFADADRRRDGWYRAMALLFAAAFHVGALLAASPGRDDRVGASGTDLEAVSVEVSIVSSDALESRSADRDKATGAAGRVHLHDGALDPDSSLAEATPVVPETKNREEEKEHEPVREPNIPAPEPAKSTKAATSSDTAPAAPAGGQAALAISNILPTPASGAAAASVGDVQAYSVSVVETLAKSRPRAAAGMETGTVLVGFEITASGTPLNVRVRKSSGSPRIDNMVIEAIQTTNFPPPPAQATLAQRTYALPYVFR